jgi:hypothetical protein
MALNDSARYKAKLVANCISQIPKIDYIDL